MDMKRIWSDEHINNLKITPVFNTYIYIYIYISNSGEWGSGGGGVGRGGGSSPSLVLSWLAYNWCRIMAV